MLNYSLFSNFVELNKLIQDLQIKINDLDVLLTQLGPFLPPPSPPKPDKFLSPLSETELQTLTQEEKNKSDQLILNAIIEISKYEFYSYQEALKFLKSKFNALRINKDFKLRQQLAQLVSNLEKDTFKLKKALKLDENQFFKELTERFGKNNDPIELMKNILITTIFDKSLIDDEINLALQIIVISIASSQRFPININLLTESDKNESDKIFAEQLQNFQKKIKNNETSGFIYLTKELNKLRINLTFYKYTAMLKDFKKPEPLKEPIINFLRYPPSKQILSLKIILKNYVFQKEIIDDTLETDLIKNALSEQFAKVTKRKKIKPDVKDFLTRSLEKFAGIAGLEKIIETLIKDYNQNLTSLQDELNKPQPDIMIILEKFKKILQKDLTQDQVEHIQNQINQGIENKKIISALQVKRALNPWLTLSNNLKKAFPQPRSQRVETIIEQLDSNFFATPRDIWKLFGRSLIIVLAKQNYYVDKFIQTFSSLGIVFLIFQHFINELNRNANFEESLGMLFNSIQVLNNPDVKRDETGADTKIGTWLKKGDISVAMKASLAPVIVDRNLEGKSLGKGYYSDQIKLGIFKGELQPLIKSLKKLISSKDINTFNEFIKSLDKLTKKPEDITKSEYYIDKQKYTKFNDELRNVLQKGIGGP